MPLLEGTDGVRKMSKSLGNYVALEDVPGDMFGKIMSVSDDLMVRYYELLTTEDLAQLKAAHPMEAKQRLAGLLVERYHGKDAARSALAAFQQKFQDRSFPNEPDVRLTLGKADLKEDGTITVTDLVAKTGLVPSKSEARRLVIQGGLEVDGTKQTDATATLKLAPGRAYQLKIGRRKFALVQLHE
jgi:tyrosyl-tRNA synthetase